MRATAHMLAAASLSLACLSTRSFAQQPAASSTTAKPRATMRAARRDGPITLDGKLDEAAWQKATPATQFTESYPNVGRAAVDPTEVRVLYDDDALYVGIRMFDAHPDSIAAQLARRDVSGIYSDWVHLIIDSYHDRRTAFRFTVNPKGVQKDVYTYSDNNEDPNWDAVWDVATRVDSVGWVAEYRIPLSQLRFNPAKHGEDGVWGFQVMRDVARRNERTSFSPWTPDGSGFVSRFGDLTGLIDLPKSERLEVVPYLSTKVTRAPGDAANPFYHSTDTKPNIGGDVKYGLPGGLALTATINPDFGQVEVDPAVVNLSAYETFFPEKRPFFLEGSDLFTFGNVVRNNDYGGQTFFYTRRIGRAPQRTPTGPGIGYVDMPDQTSIAGAAKITGKKGPWTIGLMDALTPEMHADVAGLTGTRDSTTAVDPMTNFFAGRLRRDFRNGATTVGSMLTMVNRRQSDPFRNLLTTSAGFGGLDFEHRWDDGQYVLSGFGARSQVDGSAAVIDNLERNSSHYFQRPDATSLHYDPTLMSLTGHTEEVAIQKNGIWFGSLALKNVSPGFEINDVGFHGRVDYRAISPFWGYSSNQKDNWSLNKFAGVWWNGAYNDDGNTLYNGFGSSASATFANYESANVGFGWSLASLSDRLLRGGPLASSPANWYANLGFVTDSRRALWFNPNFNFSRNVDDPSWNGGVGLYMDARPTTTFHVTFGPNYSRQFSTSQYTQSVVDAGATSTFGSRYVFADLTQTTVSLDTRMDWTLTSKLSVQSYFQPFVAVGSYVGFKEFKTPRAYSFAVYGKDQGTITTNKDAQGNVASYTVDPDGAAASPAFSISNPNFNVHSLRGNAVIRWEYRPGSALFFVWQQERSGAEPQFDFETHRDVGAIFRERPTNIFLIKAAYWLSK